MGRSRSTAGGPDSSTATDPPATATGPPVGRPADEAGRDGCGPSPRHCRRDRSPWLCRIQAAAPTSLDQVAAAAPRSVLAGNVGVHGDVPVVDGRVREASGFQWRIWVGGLDQVQDGEKALASGQVRSRMGIPRRSYSLATRPTSSGAKSAVPMIMVRKLSAGSESSRQWTMPTEASRVVRLVPTWSMGFWTPSRMRSAALPEEGMAVSVVVAVQPAASRRASRSLGQLVSPRSVSRSTSRRRPGEHAVRAGVDRVHGLTGVGSAAGVCERMAGTGRRGRCAGSPRRGCPRHLSAAARASVMTPVRM